MATENTSGTKELKGQSVYTMLVRTVAVLKNEMLVFNQFPNGHRLYICSTPYVN